MPHLLRDSYLVNLLPLNWGAGLVNTVGWPVMYNTTTILLPGSMPQPMTAEYAAEALKLAPRGKKTGTIFIPDVLKALARDASHLEILKELDWVGYAGAPLDSPTGDLISQHTRVQSFMGATDVGVYPLLLNEAADWKIHRFHPTWLQYHFDHYQDDLYELCVRRDAEDPRPCFALDPALDVYHTKDLWRPAPGREADGFWMTAGRIDDFVKLASMTKFNAIQIEQVLDRHPLIAKTVVGGDGRARPFVLVQLRDPQLASRGDALDQVWSAFEEANAHIYGEARLTRPLVIFTDVGLPLKQTAKGTVNRRMSTQMYADRIAAAYQAWKPGANGHA